MFYVAILRVKVSYMTFFNDDFLNIIVINIVKFFIAKLLAQTSIISFKLSLELKSSLEQIVGYCLAILVQVLEKQATFLELAAAHRSSMIVSPLDELLLSVNPRTGRPDYLCVVARFENNFFLFKTLFIECILPDH